MTDTPTWHGTTILSLRKGNEVVVAGELDHLTPPHNAERIASEVRGPCVLSIIKGGNHVSNNRRYMFQTQTADWLAQQLGLPKV